MPRNARIALASFIFALAVGLGFLGVAAYLRIQPPNVDFVSGHRPGRPLDLTVQTVGAYGHGVHGDWFLTLSRVLTGTGSTRPSGSCPPTLVSTRLYTSMTPAVRSVTKCGAWSVGHSARALY